MQFTLSLTFSKFLFAASVALLAWTAGVQGAPVKPYLGIRSSIVDVAKDGLSRRVNVPRDDVTVDFAAPKRDLFLPRVTDAYYFKSAAEFEERKMEGGDLARRAGSPLLDDVSYFATEDLSEEY